MRAFIKITFAMFITLLGGGQLMAQAPATQPGQGITQPVVGETHPQAGNAEQPVVSGDAVYMPIVDPNAPPVVFEFKSLPVSKQEYMRSHPKEYTIRPDGMVEETRVTPPVHDMEMKEFESLTPEKQTYILAHPEIYNVVKNSVGQ